MFQPDRLRKLRKAKNLSRKRLSGLSGVSVRTIQRTENPEAETTPQWTTVERLAKGLQVDPGVLTGEMPLPQAGNATALEGRRVQIGAEIAPKARLGYDLVKRRYGVSATDLINMAPLFFTLLAEASLARRREKLEEAREAIDRLDRMEGEIGHSIFRRAATVALDADIVEDESIARADLFGEHLQDDSQATFGDEPFDASFENPFASYLRNLAAQLDRPGVVSVEFGGLSYGRPWRKFPNYDLCNDEIKSVTNDSPDARRALETGFVRLSDIPTELMEEDVGKERAAWLEEKLPEFYKGLKTDQPMTAVANFHATATLAETIDVLKRAHERRSVSQSESGTKEEGDVR